MLYKKSALGRKYTRLITGSPGFFITFVLIGAALFLFFTVNTKIDVFKTYPAEVLSIRSETAIAIKASNIPVGSAYLYSNRNEAVFPVQIESVESIDDKVILYFSGEGSDVIKSLPNGNIFVDIPQKPETLLFRIFAKGGKAHE